MERKILGYIQLRKGPNKILLKGVFQPFRDGFKLFLKENNFRFNINKIFFFFFPFLSFLLIFIFWIVFIFKLIDFFLYSIIFFILISGIGVYRILGRGWVSNSKYALLGCYRRVSQVVSYEVGLVFIVISLYLYVNNYNYNCIVIKMIQRHYLVFGLIGFFFIWGVIVLAELNRAPFDFSERESELVSGFNVEYGSVKFAFLFLSEYGNIIFISYLTGFLFFSLIYLQILIFIFLVIWVRGVFPRYRYDNLIFLNWKQFLPLILFFFLILFFYIINI